MNKDNIKHFLVVIGLVLFWVFVILGIKRLFGMTNEECIKILKKDLTKQESFVRLYEENYDPFLEKELKNRKDSILAIKHAIKNIKNNKNK